MIAMMRAATAVAFGLVVASAAHAQQQKVATVPEAAVVPGPVQCVWTNHAQGPSRLTLMRLDQRAGTALVHVVTADHVDMGDIVGSFDGATLKFSTRAYAYTLKVSENTLSGSTKPLKFGHPDPYAFYSCEGPISQAIVR